MEVKTGIDIVYLPRFKKALKNGGGNFLQRVYHQDELVNKDIKHLAGIFALKEAVIKALSLPTDSWHDIQITYTKNGAPRVGVSSYKLEVSSYSLSISHDGNYVIGQFVALV